MKLGVSLRLSLLARIFLSLLILTSLSLVLTVVISIFLGGFLTLYLFISSFHMSDFPRLSVALSVPAWQVFAVVTGGLVVAGVSWITYLKQASDLRVQLSFWFGVLAGLYLFVVEGAAVMWALMLTPEGALLAFAGCAFVSIWVTIRWARLEIWTLRDQLVDGSTPAKESAPELDSTVRRLATLANVSPPEVYVTEQDRPESFTVGSGESAVIVVSTGTIDVLSDDELKAVLAHEVSHLANRDSRVMAAALSPVLISDDWIEDNPDEYLDPVWNAFFALLKLYGQFGVAALSRGREWGADVGAVALTGSPAALASALETLDEGRRRPETDLRDWEASVAAIDILPPAGGEVDTGPFRTHPSTEKRIERLKSMAARLESA